MTEVRELQHEMHHDQRVAASEIVRTKETVERVAEAAVRRRLLPRPARIPGVVGAGAERDGFRTSGSDPGCTETVTIDPHPGRREPPGLKLQGLTLVFRRCHKSEPEV